MFDFVTASVVVGALLPLVISLVKNQSWSKQSKRVVALVASVVAAVLTVGASEGWSALDLTDSANWATLAASFGLVYTLAQTTYSGFWEGTGPDAAATKAITG